MSVIPYKKTKRPAAIHLWWIRSMLEVMARNYIWYTCTQLGTDYLPTEYTKPLIHHPYVCRYYILLHLVSQTKLYLWEKLLYSHTKAIGMTVVAVITVQEVTLVQHESYCYSGGGGHYRARNCYTAL